MAETSASGSDPAIQGSDELQPATTQSSLSEGSGFLRTRKAVAELGRALLGVGLALRDDFSRASRPARRRVRALGGDIVQRLRDMDFSTAKLRTSALA